MYKEILRTIVGIEVFPVLSLLIFVTVFMVMLVWVMRMDRGRLATYANLPLEDAPTPSSASRPGASGGTQL
jgi:cytochrome c oxidase cbb3-type subunit IV